MLTRRHQANDCFCSRIDLTLHLFAFKSVSSGASGHFAIQTEMFLIATQDMISTP